MYGRKQNQYEHHPTCQSAPLTRAYIRFRLCSAASSLAASLEETIEVLAATPLALPDSHSTVARPSFAIISDQYTASKSVLPHVNTKPAPNKAGVVVHEVARLERVGERYPREVPEGKHEPKTVGGDVHSC